MSEKMQKISEVKHSDFNHKAMARIINSIISLVESQGSRIAALEDSIGNVVGAETKPEVKQAYSVIDDDLGDDLNIVPKAKKKKGG